jgi:hypothetical protein
MISVYGDLCTAEKVIMTILTLKAKQDHLQKVASTRDYIKALAEFVWNALDADATRVSVEFVRNGLGGLEAVVIRDNGTGISKSRALHDFESVGESWKLNMPRTRVFSRAMHGKEGRGRLRFFSLATKATWASVYKENGNVFKLSIELDAGCLETGNVSEPESMPQGAETGTVVQLSPLKATFDWLASEEARNEFNATFAPYVTQYPRSVRIL